MQHDNIIPFGHIAATQQLRLNDKSRQTVDRCRMIYARVLPPLLTSLFERLDDSLYELSDRSESDAMQASYFDAMREMRKARTRVETQFKKRVLAEYDRFWSQGLKSQLGKGAGDPSTELSLLDEESLEETLAITSLISKGENNFQRDIEALNERFGSILKRDDITDKNNPISPTIIGTVFHDLLEPLPVELVIKLVIYKLFDKFVMRYVGNIYDEINQQLKKDGVLPSMKLRVHRNSAAPSDHVATPRHEIAPVAESAATVEMQAETFNLLQNLLGNRQQSGQLSLGAPIVGRALPTVDTTELLGTLSALQNCNITLIAVAGVSDGQRELRKTLITSLQMESSGDPNKTLNKSDNDTLDVVSMLFQYIFDDPNTPDPMKVLIGRLQIPMLKIALADKAFFGKKDHPARALLNSIAHAAVGWSDDGDRSENGLYGIVERMVNLIAKEFDSDTGLFEQLNSDFAAFFSREARGAEIAEDRTTQVVRGKEQLKVAKMRVASEINNRLGARREVPDVVSKLLNDAWKDVLLLLYLRQGIESDAWVKAIETMDLLLWSVELKEEPADRKELLKRIPGLLRTLREGLAEISYDQHKMARLFKELQQSHILCLKGRLGAVKRRESSKSEVLHEPVSNENEVVVGSVVTAESADLQPPPQDQFVERANSVKMGTWIELQGEGGRNSRIKLSWKSEVTGTCIFVNRKGAKVKEITLSEFATLIQTKTATILKQAGVPLMDRALEAMMDVLKNTATSSATS